MTVDDADAASPTPATNIHSEKLDPSLRDYLMALAKREPFTKDIITEKQNIVSLLASFWPQMPEWNAQAYEVWERIKKAVEAIHLATEEPWHLRISVAAHELAPTILEEPSEIIAITTFDAIQGIERQYIVAPHEQPPRPEQMKIGAGLLIICQPMPPQNSEQISWSTHENEFGETIYTLERYQDKSLKGEDLSPEAWKQNMEGLPNYLESDHVNEVAGEFGPGNLGTGVIAGGTVNAAILQNVAGRRGERARRAAAENKRKNNPLAAPFAEAAAEEQKAIKTPKKPGPLHAKTERNEPEPNE